jgi:hypothetical protein
LQFHRFLSQLIMMKSQLVLIYGWISMLSVCGVSLINDDIGLITFSNELFTCVRSVWELECDIFY